MAKRKNKARFVLEDGLIAGNRLAGSIEVTPRGVFLSFDGYGEKCAAEGCGQPVMVEFYEGKLRLIAFGDINSEEPTYVIDMNGAAEVLRNSVRCALCKKDVPAAKARRDRDNDIVCEDCWDDRMA